MKHILLAGNPNSGKTTVFNALTGDNQRVGNWPGVTVEKKEGICLFDKQQMTITDLPGIYSLTISNKGINCDERIAAHAIVTLPADIIINIIDACCLERHLYLTSQLLELGKPMIVALNMMDIALQRGIHIDIDALSQQIKCPVIALQAHKKIGLEALQKAISNPIEKSVPLELALPAKIKQSLVDVEQQLISAKNMTSVLARYYASRIIEGDDTLLRETSWTIESNRCNDYQDFDILLADARYQKIHQIVTSVQKKNSDTSEHFTAWIDKIVLHRYLALPIFFTMMYLMFVFAVNVGGAFQDFFDITTDAIFVQGSTWLLQQIHSPQWLIALLANGVGKGINTILTFIPVIAAMFFFLAMLETSGYMARAAFVVDKVMRALGLPGKAFVPMIVGFGCNVPAIMAARTLDSEHDRLLTVLMSPFMSCSARLAIYTIFVTAFFPPGGQINAHTIIFSLYLIGIVMAVLTGFILRKTMLRGQYSPLILELPTYHRLVLRRLFKEAGLRLRYFIVRAGRMIIPVCIILGGLNALTINGSLTSTAASSDSLLSIMGQWLTPVFSPMGLTQDNWPATVGLLTGMLAKEVVVGSLNALYTQINYTDQTTLVNFDFLGSLHAALWSIPENLIGLGKTLVNPMIANAPNTDISQSVYGLMAKRFDGQVGAFAYLLFILLYIPCVSTMAAIRQEANRKLMWFSIVWSVLTAYTVAVLFYQLARFVQHPQSSILWISAMLISIGMFIKMLQTHGVKYAATNS